MSNPFETAAIPFAVSVVKGIQTLINSLSQDPVVAAGQLPGAFQVLVGQIEMQFPSLAASEFGALKTSISTQLDGVLAKLSAAAAEPAAA